MLNMVSLTSVRVAKNSRQVGVAEDQKNGVRCGEDICISTSHLSVVSDIWTLEVASLLFFTYH